MDSICLFAIPVFGPFEFKISDIWQQLGYRTKLRTTGLMALPLAFRSLPKFLETENLLTMISVFVKCRARKGDFVMDDNSLVAKWKIAGVQRILQALQTTQLEDAVNEDVCFVLSGCLGDVLELLNGIS